MQDIQIPSSSKEKSTENKRSSDMRNLQIYFGDLGQVETLSGSPEIISLFSPSIHDAVLSCEEDENTIHELLDLPSFEVDNLNNLYSTMVTRSSAGLDKDTFTEFMQQIIPGLTTHLTDILFNAFDSEEKDGIVDFKELAMGLNLMSHGTKEQKQEWAFRFFDKDGDGELSREETKMIILLVTSFSCADVPETFFEQAIDEIFDRIDENGDGRISLEEWMDNSDKFPSVFQIFELFHTFDL
eukprot:TRINITY_DN4906_c0_g1_i1.p1 TRINITY_DN4906_c0_g1~~TRINITY_DN4906_c0_g1_i1.p1  ORF type:complete len:241 (-),score=65.84 TRINITY_DN4906_c0_g1_i1:66-788(-)